MHYGFEEIGSSPSRGEFIDLMCQTDEYFQGRLRTELSDNSIEFHGSLYDYSYSSGKTQPVSVSFVAIATYSSTGQAVDPQVIVNAMMVGSVDIMVYIQYFTWYMPPDSVFQKTTSVHFESSLATSPILGVLDPPFLQTCPVVGDRDENLGMCSL